MRLKRYFGVLLLAIGMLAALSGCDFGSDEHVHSFSKWKVTKEATCVDEGVQSRECAECGYTESEKVSELGHTTVKDAAVKATCTSAGLSEGSHCSVCNVTLLAQESIPAFGHTPLKDYPVDPTCTTDGLSQGSHCGICGIVLEEQTVVPSTGHLYEKVSVVTPATCIQVGIKKFSCIWCDVSYVDTYTTDEHTPVVDPAVAPTCEEAGLTKGSHCGLCNEVLTKQNTIPATGHTIVIDAAMDPNCELDGATEGSHCGVCKVVLVAQENIPALGHQNTEEIIQDATCLQAGVKRYTCSVCGAVSEGTYSLTQYTAIELYTAAIQFVGEIVTYDRNGDEYALGTGFVYSGDGKIITNYHVIRGAFSAKITINNVTYPITSVLAYDEKLDLAVLKIDVDGLPAAKICTNPVSVGEIVYAIGFPRGLTNTYTQGTITDGAWSLDGVVYVQHDAAINNGNSGGPLINVYGEVIGINTMTTSQSQNSNLAIFASELDKLVFGEPLTLEQFYEISTTAYEKLVDMIFANGKADDYGDIVLYDYYTGADYLAIVELGYDMDEEYAYVMLYYMTGNDDVVYILLNLSGDPDALYYACEYGDSLETYNEIYGYLNAGTYTNNSKLTYTHYSGLIGYEEDVMAIYDPLMHLTVRWLATYLRDTGAGFTIEDLGFTNYTY